MKRSRLPSSRTRLSRRLIAYDVVCASLSPAIAFWLRDPELFARGAGASFLAYSGASVATSVAAFMIFRTAHSLPQFFSFVDAAEIAKASSLSVAAVSALMFAFTRLEEVPRSIPFIHVLILTAGLIGGRIWRRARVQRRDLGDARRVKAHEEKIVILVGVSRLAWFYMRLLDSFASRGRRVVGLLDANRALAGRTMFGQIVLGCPQDADVLLDDYASHGVFVSEFVICDQRPHVVEIYRDQLADVCARRGIDLTDLAHDLALDEQEEPGEFLAPEKQPTSYLRWRPYFDSAVGGAGLALLAPVLIMIGALIYLTLGSPVVFWQRRLGKDGYPIHVYKFRSMRNPVDRSGRALSQEERETAFGNLLRATRLDELPQLFNVAMGDMAIIGPRPLLPVDQPEDASTRLLTPPGITGWAQIHGGKLVSVTDKNAMDEFYVENASFALDAKIVLATIKTIVKGDRLQSLPMVEPEQARLDQENATEVRRSPSRK